MLGGTDDLSGSYTLPAPFPLSPNINVDDCVVVGWWVVRSQEPTHRPTLNLGEGRWGATLKLAVGQGLGGG